MLFDQSKQLMFDWDENKNNINIEKQIKKKGRTIMHIMNQSNDPLNKN